MASFEERFKLATKQLKASGVGVYRNVQGCCRSCIGVDKFDNPTTPIVWHYGGQGNRFSLDGDVVYNTNNGYVENIYFNHSNLTDALKDMVVNIFAVNGIVLDWDKSDSHCIVVKPQLSVEHRTLEEQAYLVNGFLNQYGLGYSEMFGGRNRYLFESLWSVAISADAVVESWFKKERDERDRYEAQEREREERQRKREAQEALRDAVIEVVDHSDKLRLLVWLQKADVELSDADVADKGKRVVALEDEAFVGAYSDVNDIVLEHYGEQIRMMPKYFVEKLDFSSIRYDLFKDYYLGGKIRNGWNEPFFVWKKEVV